MSGIKEKQRPESTTQIHFPSVCYGEILSFLSLSDCLSFAATSTRGLVEVLDSLQSRREQLKEPVVVAKSKLEACGMSVYGTNPSNVSSTSTELLIASEEFVTLLPSTQHRVGLLIEELPSQCDVYHDVQQLRVCLLENIPRGLGQAALLPTNTMLLTLRRLVLPLRLLTNILRKSLGPNDQQRCTMGLANYIGHVTCLAYLFDNMELSREVLRYTTKKTLVSTSSTYSGWVATHASLIRQTAFVHKSGASLSATERTTGTILQSEATLPLEGASWDLTWLPPHQRALHSDRLCPDSRLALIYDDFAPLGPQFRGRDIVQIHDVSAGSMQSGDPLAMEWIRVAHTQAFKSRPMTVRPPIVRWQYT